MSGKTVIGWHS